jgi:hypothetical protein
VAILTGSRHVRELLYTSDTVARQLDELQFTLGEGPCLDAFFQNWPQLWAPLHTTIAVDALWPGFAAEAVNLGAQALLAFPVPEVSSRDSRIPTRRHLSAVLGRRGMCSPTTSARQNSSPPIPCRPSEDQKSRSACRSPSLPPQ